MEVRSWKLRLRACSWVQVLPVVLLIFLITSGRTIQGAAPEVRREPGTFVLKVADASIMEAYEMAVSVIEGNISPWRRGLLEEMQPALMAGKGYASPWTRDASYNTLFCVGLMYPKVAKNTLMSVLLRDDAGVRIGGQYWDCISWVTGAWSYYLCSGDLEFLRLAYQATVNSLRYFETREFDRATGLFCGPGWSDGVAGYPTPYDNAGGSSFILDYAKHNNGVDKIRMKALSTNCLYCNAYRIAARMGALLGVDKKVRASFMAKHDALRQAINSRLWIESAGHYAYFLDAKGEVDHSMESLGHAQAILFGIADATRAARVFDAQYVAPHGVPCVWPLFPRFTREAIGRHCGTVWPQIQGFWALAAASRGQVAIMDHEFRALTDMALASGDFREIYHPFTGKPYGGMQVGRLWRSEPAQTWAATAYIAMLLRGIVGLRYSESGLMLRPCMPKRITALRLQGVKYQKMCLDIHITGSGTVVQRLLLDDEPIASSLIPAQLTGRHSVRVEMTEVP